MRQITMTRMVYNKEELKIKKTWKDVWIHMARDEKKHGQFYILFGDWSGYNSSQYRITHVDYLPHHEAKRLKLKIVVFTDGTTMKVWAEPMTIGQLLAKGLMRREGYTSLLRKAMGAGEEYYKV